VLRTLDLWGQPLGLWRVCAAARCGPRLRADFLLSRANVRRAAGM